MCWPTPAGSGGHMPALPLDRGACRVIVSPRRSRRSTGLDGRGPADAGAARAACRRGVCMVPGGISPFRGRIGRVCPGGGARIQAQRSGPGRGPGQAARPGWRQGIEGAVRQAAGTRSRFWTRSMPSCCASSSRMTAAAERRDLLEAGAPGAGIAFPPLKRRIRPLPPDRAAEAWLKRFRALGGKTDRPVAAKIAADAGNAPGQPDAGEA